MRVRFGFCASIVVLLASSSCNDLACGPGTQRQQLKDGTVQCLPVAATPGTTKCNSDGGVMLVGGDQCVSVVQCGAGTTLDPATNSCVPSGGSGPHMPEPCPAPMPGNLCVNGAVLHFVDHSFLSNEMVRVALYEPLAFLNDPTSTPIAEVVTGDTFIFKNVKAPATGLVALAVSGPGGATSTYQLTGVGNPIVPGQSYRLDAFAVKVTDVAAWSASSGGVDYDLKGAYIGAFYKDVPASLNQLPANETMPAAGVKLVQVGSMMSLPGTQYFGANLNTIDPAASTTSAIGVAMPAPNGLDTFGGLGGGVTKWESFNGSSLPHAVFIQRFHPAP